MKTILVMVVAVMCFSGCAKNVKPVPPDAVNGQTVEAWEKTLPTSPQTAFSATSKSFTRWNRFWFGSAVIGQTADAITTMNGISGGKCREQNPILGEDPGAGAVVALKAAVFGAGVWLAEYYYADHPDQQKYRNYVYGSLAIFGAGAATWNSSQDCE